jgi:hypothetical protein
VAAAYGGSMTPYQYFLAWTVAFCLATIAVWLACELASWVSRWWWRRAYRESRK